MSMKTIEVAKDLIIEKVKANARIKVDATDVESKISKLFLYIEHFNSLPEDTSIIEGHQLEEWKILNEFKDFVLPNSIRYESGSRTYTDLLGKREKNGFKPSLNEYNDLIARFRNYFKKDTNDNFVSLASLKINRSFEEVRQIISVGDDVRYMDNPYIPLPVNDGVRCLFSKFYFNSTIEQVVDDYVAKLQLI